MGKEGRCEYLNETFRFYELIFNCIFRGLPNKFIDIRYMRIIIYGKGEVVFRTLVLARSSYRSNPRASDVSR